MLKVYFNKVSFEVEGCIGNTSKYFDAEYEPSWFSSETAKQIIKDIDNSEYISGEYIESPVLGGIPPMMLSTGCKTLLLLLNEPELIVSGDRMGDNCFPWLLRIAEKRDITITLSHSVELMEPFEIYSIRSDKVIKTNLELLGELYCN